MESKEEQEKILGLKDEFFIKREQEIMTLQKIGEYANQGFILLCLENIKCLETYSSTCEDFDEYRQIDLLNKLSEYYVMIFRALSELKSPQEQDELDRYKYGLLAKKYNLEAANQIELERMQRLETQDADYTLAVSLQAEEEEVDRCSRLGLFADIQKLNINDNESKEDEWDDEWEDKQKSTLQPN